MFIVKHFNDEIVASAETQAEAVNEVLSKYNFEVEETEEEIVDFEGRKLLQSTVDEINAARAAAAVERFNAEYFNTTLGYIRRQVPVRGTTKDFLAEVLPLIVVGTPVVTYNYMATTSELKPATAEFIAECREKYYSEFYPCIATTTEETTTEETTTETGEAEDGSI